jgi:hypothetical protein
MYKSEDNTHRCAVGCTMPEEFFSHTSYGADGETIDMTYFWIESGVDCIPLDYFEKLIENFTVPKHVARQLTEQLKVRLGDTVSQDLLTRYLKARSIQSVMGHIQTMHDHHARMCHHESAFANSLNWLLENIHETKGYLEDLIISWSWNYPPTGFLKVNETIMSYDNLNLKFSNHYIDDVNDNPLTWDDKKHDYTDVYYQYLNSYKANSYAATALMDGENIEDEGA